MTIRFIFPNRWVVALDIVGGLVWAYVVLGAFFVDFRGLLIAAVGEVGGALFDFRFVGFLAVLACLAIWKGVANLILTISYWVLFPLIFLFWKLPAALIVINSWSLFIAIFNSIISSVLQLRYKVVSAFAYCVFAILILFGEGIFLQAGIFGLLVCIFVSYGRSFVGAFRTPDFAKAYAAIFDGLRNYCIKESVDQEEQFGPRGVRIANLPEEVLERYRDMLQTRVAVSSGSLYFARKLEDYQKSQISVASGIMSVATLLFLTLMVFSFIYFGIEKLYPKSIVGVAEVNAFEYVKLAFSNMLFGSVSSASVSGWLVESTVMFQRLLTTGLIGIFLTVFLGVRNKKFDAELQTAIKKIEDTSEQTGLAVVSHHGYADLRDAMQDLVDAKAAFANFLVKIYLSTGPHEGEKN
jgi:hypothetical protein